MTVAFIPLSAARQLALVPCSDPGCRRREEVEQVRSSGSAVPWQPLLAEELQARGWRLAPGGGWTCPHPHAAPRATTAPVERRSITCAALGCDANEWVSEADPSPHLRTVGWVQEAILPGPHGTTRTVQLGAWYHCANCAAVEARRLEDDSAAHATFLDGSGNPHDPRLAAVEPSEANIRAGRIATTALPSEFPHTCRSCGAKLPTPLGPGAGAFLATHGWVVSRGATYCGSRCAAIAAPNPQFTLQG